MITALLLGMTGLVALGTLDASLARDRVIKDSYEAHGAKYPPVPGFALWNYKSGMCWKSRHRDRLQGEYIPCSEFFKKRKQ
jgi:hypothetical protein